MKQITFILMLFIVGYLAILNIYTNKIEKLEDRLTSLEDFINVKRNLMTLY